MQLLADDQIKHIEERLALASLTNTSLSIDILDHLCCMIEERLDLGWEYPKAEKEVFNQMGVLQIKAIEQETNILTQNKLIMKKRTKIIGLVALILMTTGFILKTMHIQYGGITWGVGVLTAVFGFAVLFTIDRFSYEKTFKGKFVSIVGYLGASSFLIGVGLKLLRQPGAIQMIAFGGFVLLVHFVVTNSSVYDEKLS